MTIAERATAKSLWKREYLYGLSIISLASGFRHAIFLEVIGWPHKIPLTQNTSYC
jgi:hypothetical protein